MNDFMCAKGEIAVQAHAKERNHKIFPKFLKIVPRLSLSCHCVDVSVRTYFSRKVRKFASGQRFGSSKKPQKKYHFLNAHNS